MSEYKFDKSIAAALERTRNAVANMPEGQAAIAPMGYFGNVWVRAQYYLKAGDSHKGHKHNYDHMSLVVTGTIEVSVDGEEPVVYTAPTFFEVPADKIHNLKAVEDGTCVFCVFAVRDKKGDIPMQTVEVDDPLSGNGEKFNNIKSKDRVRLK